MSSSRTRVCVFGIPHPVRLPAPWLRSVGRNLQTNAAACVSSLQSLPRLRVAPTSLSHTGRRQWGMHPPHPCACAVLCPASAMDSALAHPWVPPPAAAASSPRPGTARGYRMVSRPAPTPQGVSVTGTASRQLQLAGLRLGPLERGPSAVAEALHGQRGPWGHVQTRRAHTCWALVPPVRRPALAARACCHACRRPAGPAHVAAQPTPRMWPPSWPRACGRPADPAHVAAQPAPRAGRGG
jgi:hypothetical protein